MLFIIWLDSIPKTLSIFRIPTSAIIEDFWTCIHELDKMDQRQRRLNGRAGFGFSGDQSGSQSLYKIDGMINGSKGIYPGELTFTSKNIGMVLNNGKFSENVSNIYMAYNYHPQWGTVWVQKILFS